MTAAAGLAVDSAAKPPIFWGPFLKDAVLAALVAVLLALPLVGLQTYDIGGGALGIRTHFDWVAIGGAAVFAGRLALRVLQQLYRTRPTGRARVLTSIAAWGNRQALPITLLGIGFAVALPFLPFSSRYLIDLGTTVLIYVMLGWGLNVVVGLAGLLDLGYVAFYAVGAYTFGLLARDLDFTFWEALPFSGLVAASFGVVLGFPVLRLRGDYLAIVTLGFGEIIRIVLLNWAPVTGGPNGIGGIPRPSFLGLHFARSAPEGSAPLGGPPRRGSALASEPQRRLRGSARERQRPEQRGDRRDTIRSPPRGRAADKPRIGATNKRAAGRSRSRASGAGRRTRPRGAGTRPRAAGAATRSRSGS